MELQWPLVVFTLFICLGAGTFAVTGLLAGLNKASEIQLPSVLVALVAIVAGGVASFLHLQHFERAFNGFGHITSGITQELIGIAVVVIVAAVFAVLSRKGAVPAVLGWVALIVSVGLVIVMSLSYTMASRPVWASPLLVLYYLSNAALLGGAAVSFIASVKGADATWALNVSLAGAALTVVSSLAYAVYIPSSASAFTSVGNYFDPTHPTKAMVDPQAALSGFLTGDQAVLFWGGVVALGCLVPLVLAFLARKKTGSALSGLAVGTLIGAVTGAVSFRIIFYALGYSVFVFY
jgi:DMSO reductase anchor subunit